MATRYWVGNGGDYADTAHWSASSGGAGGASVPGLNDDIVFNGNSFNTNGQIVTVSDSIRECRAWTISGCTNSPTFSLGLSGKITVYGSITFDNTMQMASKGTVFIRGSGTINVTTGGTYLGWWDFRYLGTSGGTFSQQDDITLEGMFYVRFGTVGSNNYVSNNHNITAGSIEFHLEASGQTATLGSGVFTVVGGGFSGPEFLMQTVGTATLSAASATIVGANAGALLILGNEDGRTYTYGTVEFTGTGSGFIENFGSAFGYHPTYVIDTINVADSIDTLQFEYHVNYDIGTLNLSGAPGDLLTVTTSGGVATTIDADVANLSYLNIQNITAAGGSAPWDAGTGSVDGGNNSNITFAPLYEFKTQFHAGTGGTLVIAPVEGTAFNPILDGSAITATRTYVLPDADGTLVLAAAFPLGTGEVVFTDGSGALTTDPGFTFDGTQLVAPQGVFGDLFVSSFTEGYIPYATTDGQFTNTGDLFYDSGTGTFSTANLVAQTITDLFLTEHVLVRVGTGGILEDFPLGLPNEVIGMNDAGTENEYKKAIVRLSQTTGINAKTTGTTTLYTVPAGRTAIITHAIIRVTAASAITVVPTLGIGVAAGEDDIFGSTPLTGLDATTKIYTFNASGTYVSVAAAGVIKLGIDTGATATTDTIAVELFGFLL